MISHRLALLSAPLSAFLVGLSPALGAQDTLQLGALQAAAVTRDARAAQPELLRAQSSLRLTSLDMERRPQLS
ncbi:MAG: hypothetical protein IT360_25015, partial [Gemmatimonadaceae bacterium]|nr:hypothetical protein [Gemmatimonadaceae bacterium]